MELDVPVPLRHMPKPRHERREEDNAWRQVANLPVPTDVEEEGPATYTTSTSPFGLYRAYDLLPTHDPGTTEGILSKCDALTLNKPRAPVDKTSIFGPPPAPTIDPETGAPFSSLTTAYVLEWQNTGGSLKSAAEIERLCKDFMQRPGFDLDEVGNINVGVEMAKVDKYLDNFAESDGWETSNVKLRVPCEGVKFPLGEEEAPVFTVEGVRWRKITSLIKRKQCLNLPLLLLTLLFY
jgi:hypothetical protein